MIAYSISATFRTTLCSVLCALMATPLMAQGPRLSEEHRQRAHALAERMEAYLLSEQDEVSGGWRVNPDGITFPAITALVVNGLLLDPQADLEDSALKRAISYLLSQQQPSGGIYDTVLPSYNTSCAISALSRVPTDEAREAVKKAMNFLLSLQWGEVGTGPEAQVVDPSHAFYGGVGYGQSGRPDASNLTFFLQALHDGGYEHTDPAVQRALVFLTRLQMQDEVNDMPYADGSSQGGFIYATSPNANELGVGESKAGMIEESLDDGTKVSRLRAYGSMTYAAFKSFTYARLPADDSRVAAARRWISEHYTLIENPGLGEEGFYYFVLVFGRAMDAWGEPTLSTNQGERRWAEDLIERLEELQDKDGSMRSIHPRWLENDPVLITAYSLIALRHATNE